MKLFPKLSSILLVFIIIKACTPISFFNRNHSIFNVKGINRVVPRCEISKDCKQFVAKDFKLESICKNNICHCSASRRKTDCFKKMKEVSESILGKCPCSKDKVCHRGVCYCLPGFEPSSKRTCINQSPVMGSRPNLVIDDFCIGNDGCFNHLLETQTMYCEHYKCKCKEGFKPQKDKTCARGPLLGVNSCLVYFSVVILMFQLFCSFVNF